MSGDRLDFLRHDEDGLGHTLPELLDENERNAVLWNWPLRARAAQLPPPTASTRAGHGILSPHQIYQPAGA